MRRTPLIVAGAAALAITLAACGGDDSTATDDTTPTAGETTGGSLTVGAEDNLKFDAESYETEAGEVEILYKNNGSVAHTLLIKDLDGFKLAVGQEDTGTVELEPGTYEIYCDVAGHEAAGMTAELTVS